MSTRQTSLACTTWNLAAINDNPFEYYMDSPDPAYAAMLSAVERHLDKPGTRECTLGECVPKGFVQALDARMRARTWPGTDAVRNLWETRLRHQRIVSDFLKDAELGRKRLISMPGRMTNTVDTAAGPVYRPSVISPYAGRALASKAAWGRAWLRFLFDADPHTGSPPHCTRLQRIPRAKYPALTAEEEAISLPLQTLYLALFDCVLVHLLDVCAPTTWRPLRRRIVRACMQQKAKRTLALLRTRHCDQDVVCLQEVAASFVALLRADARLSKQYACIAPAALDAKRDQNSVVLLSRRRFDPATVAECTEHVLKQLSLSDRAKVQAGDLVAVTVVERDTGRRYLIASFHGDTNGLATVPVVRALCTTRTRHSPKAHVLVLGLDANSHDCPATPSTRGKYLRAPDLHRTYTALGLTSCWGGRPKWSACYTTGTARTCLQPQLNKSVRRRDVHKTGTAGSAFQPKDFILVSADAYTAQPATTAKDNTGKGAYREGSLFPTVTFPSDHAILTSTFRPNTDPTPAAGTRRASTSTPRVRTRRARGGCCSTSSSSRTASGTWTRRGTGRSGGSCPS